MSFRFDSVSEVRTRLREVDYLSDDGIAGIVYLADRLGKPILVEGPAGTGKTQLAKSVADIIGARASSACSATRGSTSRRRSTSGTTRSSCCASRPTKAEGDATRGRRSRTTSSPTTSCSPGRCSRPSAPTDPVVLLIDEVDRVEVETEALLLEILSDYQVSIPELGTITARQIPLVFLTSNNTRELSEALKRRCLFLHVDYPDMEREKEIVLTKVPDITESLADQVARIVRSIRQLELKKSPSVSETLDWARTLLLLGVEKIDAEIATGTSNILLKYQTDIAKAHKEFANEGSAFRKGGPFSQQ
jgi:MoxR-like ATPase